MATSYLPLSNLRVRQRFPSLASAAELLSEPHSSAQRHTSGVVLEEIMNGVIYIVGLIVVVLAILSFLGLR
jgi:type III secretory pathway component EscU